MHVFLELALILIGVGLASMGVYWGGMTDSRTSWVAIGVSSLALLGITVFSAAAERTTPEWAFAATSAGIAALAAVAGGVIFLAALVAPGVVFRRIAGWLLLVLGLGIAFLGYADSISVWKP